MLTINAGAADSNRHGPDMNLIKKKSKAGVMIIQNPEDKIWLPVKLVIELKIRDKRRNSFVGTNFLHSATCEQQSISSLNCEAMFGNFQDLDHNGSSALRAYDRPPTSKATVCIFTHIKSTEMVRYEHFTEKGIHRAWAAYIRILLIGRA